MPCYNMYCKRMITKVFYATIRPGKGLTQSAKHMQDTEHLNPA